MSVDQELEDLMSHLGEYGKYQRTQFILHSLGALTAGLHMLTLVTIAPTPEHRCAVPDVEVNGTELAWNSSEVLSWIHRDEGGKYQSCLMFDSYTNKTSKCNSWVYDHTYYTTSRTMDWNMVCDRRWMLAVAQMMYMFGVFTGAVTLGTLADKVGRKTIFYISAVMQLVLGILVAFVSEYYTFIVLEFMYGVFGSAGSYITGFVLTMELVGPTKRTFCGIIFQAVFAMGIMLVAVWGYFIRDRFYLQLIYGAHSLLLIGHWWLIDESPRWLWAQGRKLESIDIVDKAVKINRKGNLVDRKEFIANQDIKASAKSSEETSYGILDLFRTRNLRTKSLNVCLSWFANSLGYYGLSLSTGKMSGDPFILLFIMALVEMPSYTIVILLLDKAGRRFILSSFMIMGGTALMCAAYVPEEGFFLSPYILYIVFFGKFCIAGSFAVIYNYSAELFPTVLRNTGLGVGSMCARLSAALTPLIGLMDSFDKRIPMTIFASITLISGALGTLLPETVDKTMPQSLEDGEQFGIGDSCFTTGCFGRSKSKEKHIKLDDG
uniref:Organic cation transporter protein n=2 Tax=Cacopsylla melanoneura TaxID=428564 RepID=A0A8D8LZQ5_9HEMI